MEDGEEPRHFEILLAEDNPGEARLVQQALKDSNVSHRVTTAQDGEEALAMLRREGRYRTTRRPDVILLDLRLPGMDGQAVMDELIVDPELRFIPVVMLTGSQNPDDITKALQSGAVGYITKPIEAGQLAALLNDLDSGWLKDVIRPPLPS